MRDTLQVAGNELVRTALRTGVRLVGHVMRWELDRAVARYRDTQHALRARYGVRPDTPIRTYDDEVRRSVEACAERDPSVRFAYTSGSTNEPKKIAFTPARIRAIKRGNLSVIARMLQRYPISRAGLFILSGLQDDDSLSTLILSDRGHEPPYLSGLLMPARYLAMPAMTAHVERYGTTAARTLLLVLSNPGLIYSTNPSTLALFLTDLYEYWDRSTALIRALSRAPADFDRATHRIVGRIAAPGWQDRLARIAEATEPVPMAQMCPGLRVYYCWDGGYVRPFLDQVRAYLPSDRFRLIPMYSMSTETIETVNYFDGDRVRFLAIAPGVLYDFLPDGAPDDPAHLVPPWELAPGRVYTMVVSDAYGLVRYQTEDLFECTGRVGEVPDLRFLRRRGLTYSFTGEKLTDAQLEQAFGELRARYPALPAAGVQLTLIPWRAEHARLPSYRLVLAHPTAARPVDLPPLEDIAASFEHSLGQINHEFAGKRSSSRLDATRAVVLPYDQLAAQLDPKTRTDADRAGRVWDTQFKLLPLYKQLWHEYDLDPA
ncbi:MAG TPA: GH3 auxin-responsive promoter family protein [Kofleriaceae bacterium]|nr:GH3 auxin-responsive promoter family protein [Kofleriaceae bacterium]